MVVVTGDVGLLTITMTPASSGGDKNASSPETLLPPAKNSFEGTWEETTMELRQCPLMAVIKHSLSLLETPPPAPPEHLLRLGFLRGAAQTSWSSGCNGYTLPISILY